MLGVVSILQRLRGEAWVGNFVRGLTPAVAILMVIVAWQILRGEGAGIGATTLVIALVSLAALLLRASAPMVGMGGLGYAESVIHLCVRFAGLTGAEITLRWMRHPLIPN